MGKGKSTKSSSSGKIRDHDKESGKQRVRPQRQELAVQEEEAEDFESSHNELSQSEEEDTRRADPNRSKKLKAKSQKGPKKGDKPTVEVEYIEEEEQKTDKSIVAGSTTVNTLLILANRVSITTFITTGRSYYIPDFSSTFEFLSAMGRILSDNQFVHQGCPEFNSLALYVHGAYTIFYNYLRVQETAGTIDRLERRALRRLTNQVKPESWTVLGPITQHLKEYGIVDLHNYYQPVVPRMPSFTPLTISATNTTPFLELSNVIGGGRVPLIPLMVEFLRRYGAKSTVFNPTTGILHPSNQVLDARHTFLGYAAGKTTDKAQSLFFNRCWMEPAEMEDLVEPGSHAIKQARVQRWRIPPVTATTEYNDIEHFMLVEDGRDIEWLTSLNTMVNKLTPFFPGSTNLGQIVHTTTPESLTPFTFTQHRQRVYKDDVWYHGRKEWRMEANVIDAAPTTLSLVQIASTVASNANYSTHLIPTANAQNALAAYFSPNYRGPYFVQDASLDASKKHVPLLRGEMCDLPDPLTDLQSTIETHLFDKLGGRASR
nr:capsid protein [Sarcosphaera coronaria partitivirus]